MSTTQGPSESIGAPLGAVPQPPPAGPPDEADQSQALRLTGRSGDTQVVFRLDRDVPFVHRLRELAADRLERLLENPRMFIAGLVGVVGVGALAVVIGGAYRGHPTPIPATPARPPVVLPLPPQPAPSPAATAPTRAPAALTPPAPAEVEALPEPQPAPRPVVRHRKPRPRVVTAPAAPTPARKAAPATHPGPRPAAPARW